MRPLRIALLSAVLAVVVGSPARALEKTAARVPDESRGDEWNAATSYTIAYYNSCQGWIWLWSGFAPGDLIGTCFDYCLEPAHDGSVFGAWVYISTPSPSGYGFTGTISVRSADENCCPVRTLASQPWLPGSQWNFHPFVVPTHNERPSIVLQWAARPGYTAVSRIGSDHPAAGPTGPAACGVCYPTTRLTHSFYYGSAGQTLCPGSPMNDGTCDVEWMIGLFVGMCKYVPPVAVGPETVASSWGQIKALYR